MEIFLAFREHVLVVITKFPTATFISLKETEFYVEVGKLCLKCRNFAENNANFVHSKEVNVKKVFKPRNIQRKSI